MDCGDDKLISELCSSFKVNSGDSVPVECVWEPRGRRLVFTHGASFRWVGADTGRVSTHRMTDRRRLPHASWCESTQEPDTICYLMNVNQPQSSKPQITSAKRHHFSYGRQTAPQASAVGLVCTSVYLESCYGDGCFISVG